jgi:very-short-patch-repair endonuclease
MQYDKLNDKAKRDLIEKEYHGKGISFAAIGEKYGSYGNKIRRDAIRLGVKIRDKSQAQKNALANGKAKHPTKGTKRPEEVKQKIGSKVLENWDNLSAKELKQRQDKARKNWENKSDDEKQNILNSAHQAVREASKTGSKLEKFLLSKLLSDGYKVEFHKEQSILNTKLQIDIFIPKLNVAIEVDGPSHFEPVWGEDALKKNQKYDNKKTGLLLGKGLYLIRLVQSKDFSVARGWLLYQELKAKLVEIEAGTVNSGKLIKIGE